MRSFKLRKKKIGSKFRGSHYLKYNQWGHHPQQPPVDILHRPTGIHVCKPCSSIRLACDMPYFSARGFVGSVIFHTPLGKWVTLEQNMLPVAASYKEEERQRCLARPTQWPLRMTVKWFTHMTNASVWKVFFQPCVFSLVSRICAHAPREVRKETSNTLSIPCWVILSLAAFS